MRSHTRSIGWLMLGAVVAMPDWALAAAKKPADSDRCVILVSIDGLAHFYLEDKLAHMPTLRRLAREGACAEQGMVTAFPSVTWPAHTAIATGTPPADNGMIGNSYLDRATGEKVTLLCDPVYDKDQVVKVPTLFDVVHRAGLKTAAICWPATRNARTLDWMVPDMPGDAWQKYGTQSWLKELRAAGIPVDSHAAWVQEPAGGVQRDWLYIRMAAHVLARHQPDLLMIHLVEPDHTQHRYGPRSPEAYWCASYADSCIRDLLAAIARSPRKASTTLVVCSDHGFFPIRREIRPNVVLRQLGLAGAEGGKAAAICHSQGGATGLYIFDADRKAQILAQVQAPLAALEGVAAVLTAEQSAGLGQPPSGDNPWAPDLWLAAKSGYSFSDSAAGDAAVVDRSSVGGTHGYLPHEPDMLAMCLAWGAGVEPGTSLGRIEVVDLAPSIAAMFGLEMPTARGKVLKGLVTR